MMIMIMILVTMIMMVNKKDLCAKYIAKGGRCEKSCWVTATSYYSADHHHHDHDDHQLNRWRNDHHYGVLDDEDEGDCIVE